MRSRSSSRRSHIRSGWSCRHRNPLTPLINALVREAKRLAPILGASNRIRLAPSVQESRRASRSSVSDSSRKRSQTRCRLRWTIRIPDRATLGFIDSVRFFLHFQLSSRKAAGHADDTSHGTPSARARSSRVTSIGRARPFPSCMACRRLSAACRRRPCRWSPRRSICPAPKCTGPSPSITISAKSRRAARAEALPRRILPGRGRRCARRARRRQARRRDGRDDADRRVTLEAVYCLGLCHSSPAAMLDKRVYGMLDEARLDALVKEAQA